MCMSFVAILLGRLRIGAQDRSSNLQFQFDSMLQTMQIHHASSSVCDWPGITCHDEAVRAIAWDTPRFSVRSMNWMPSTVTSVDIRRADVRGSLETRCMPRAMETYTVTGCGLRSTLDMRSLPSLLRTLNLEHNFIRGTLCLDALPGSIASIKLGKNSLDKVYIDNLRLPASLMTVNLEGNFGKIKFITPSGGRISPCVQTGR